MNVVSGCALSHNGHFLATCSWDKSICLYDINSGSYRSNGPTILTGHAGCVSACCFSPDGMYGYPPSMCTYDCLYNKSLCIFYLSG